MARIYALELHSVELQKTVAVSVYLKSPNQSRSPAGKAAKPVLSLDVWSLPTVPAVAKLVHPEVLQGFQYQGDVHRRYKQT